MISKRYKKLPEKTNELPAELIEKLISVIKLLYTYFVKLVPKKALIKTL